MFTDTVRHVPIDPDINHGWACGWVSTGNPPRFSFTHAPRPLPNLSTDHARLVALSPRRSGSVLVDLLVVTRLTAGCAVPEPSPRELWPFCASFLGPRAR